MFSSALTSGSSRVCLRRFAALMGMCHGVGRWRLGPNSRCRWGHVTLSRASLRRGFPRCRANAPSAMLAGSHTDGDERDMWATHVDCTQNMNLGCVYRSEQLHKPQSLYLLRRLAQVVCPFIQSLCVNLCGRQNECRVPLGDGHNWE